MPENPKTPPAGEAPAQFLPPSVIAEIRTRVDKTQRKPMRLQESSSRFIDFDKLDKKK